MFKVGSSKKGPYEAEDFSLCEPVMGGLKCILSGSGMQLIGVLPYEDIVDIKDTLEWEPACNPPEWNTFISAKGPEITKGLSQENLNKVFDCFYPDTQFKIAETAYLKIGDNYLTGEIDQVTMKFIKSTQHGFTWQMRVKGLSTVAEVTTGSGEIIKPGYTKFGCPP